MGASLGSTGSPLAPAPHGPERQEIKFQAFAACPRFGNARKPARSGWISSPAGQGFMSTQRQEGRWQRLSCTEHAKGSSQIWLLFLAWFARVIATVGTAPPHAGTWLQAVRLATIPLQSGHRFTQPDRQEIRRPSRSSPPTRAARSAIAGAPATCRSSLQLNPAPPVLVRLHPSLSNFPAGKCRWTERYDGKRDLYFLNAA
jgi:hypothetical protein